MDVTYVLPLRATHPPSPDLVEHLAAIAAVAQVVVADSSPDEVFAANARAWGSFATHVRPDPRHRCANGKVHNVLTALDHVRTEAVGIADDDVRYTPALLRALLAELAVADVVVPQNVFVAADGSRVPWHAVWDTARTLLNRVSGGDFPGTLAVRTEALRRTGGYDGDVLFENLELMRTVAAAGGTVRRADGLFVPRRPPTAAHFRGQRTRQAYDEFARPRRLVAQLAIVPVVLAARRSPQVLIAMAGAAVLAAEIGRRRNGLRQHAPVAASLLAPAWVLERGCGAWLAVIARLRGGVRYGGGRLVVAAHSDDELRRRHRSPAVRVSA